MRHIVIASTLAFAAAMPAFAINLDDERATRAQDALTSADPLTAISGYFAADELYWHATAPAARRQFLEDAATKSVDANVRAFAGAALAQELVHTGDVVKARERITALGFVTQARAIGPFTNTGGSSFAAAFPFDVAKQHARVAGVERDVGWQTVSMEPTGELDLVPRIAPIKESREVLVVDVEAAVAGPAALRVGSTGPVRALVNGAEVLRADTDRPLAMDQSVAGINLVQGANLLFIELGALGEEAAVRVRLTKPDGQPLAGLRFLVDDAGITKANATKPSKDAPPAVVDAVALARGLPADASTAKLRDAVDIERALRAGDSRRKPLDIEVALHRLRSNTSAPAQVDAWLGEVHRAHDLTAARMDFERAIAEDARCIDAIVGLAAVRMELDDSTNGIALLQSAQALWPTSDVIARKVLEAKRLYEHSGIASDLAILARANLVKTRGNLELAADVFEERGDRASMLALLEESGDLPRAHRVRAEMARARSPDDKEYLDARVAAAKAQLALREGNHAQAEQVAQALLAAGRKPELTAFLDDRQRNYPERAEPLALRAKVALLGADRESARTSLLAALALRPQDAELRRTLRGLGEAPDELVATYGLDPATFANDPVPPDALRIGAHVVATTTAVRFFENGLGRVITDRLIKIHDAKKAEGLASFQFPYSAGRESVEVLIAERITRDGRREPALRIVDNAPIGKEDGAYNDVSEKVVQLGQLQDGDLIHVRTRKDLVGQQNLFGDFFGDLEPIQSFVPVRHFRFVVEAPLSRQLSYGGKNAPKPKISEDAEKRTYDFVVDDAKPVEGEPGMPPFLEEASFVSVSTYAQWDAMGQWYEKLIAPQLALDDDLKRVAKEIVASSHSDLEKVQQVYDHVVTTTRYVGIELGIHGWLPYPVSEVQRRKYGDCKDKASLLVALLREVGVPANIVLVRTANLGNITPDPPSMWTFNHAIAYVPSLDLFLDGTAETSGFKETPPLDQGALVLVVGAHGKNPKSELRNIPIQPADVNLNVSDYVLHVDTDGSLRLHGTEKFRGSHNAEERVQLADPSRRTELLEKQLGEVMPGTVVAKLAVSDLSLDVDEISYQFEATLPQRAVREGGALSMDVSLYPHDLSGSYASASTRKTDIFIEHPWHTRNVMRYVLPPGYAVPELPSGGTVKSDHVAFTQTITRTSDGFIVDEDTAILSRRVPLADYASFRDACLRADALMKRKLRMVTR